MTVGKMIYQREILEEGVGGRAERAEAEEEATNVSGIGSAGII
jgi:hypothetical protein